MLSYNFIPGTYLEEPTTHKPQVMFNPEAEASNIIGSLRAMRGTAPTSGIMSYPEFGEYQSYELPKEEMGEFMKGVHRGIESTQAMSYGALGAIGDLLGIDSLRDAGYEGYLRNMEEAEQYKGSTQSFSDIFTEEGSAVDWALGTAGELLPTMAGALVSGGIGSAAGYTLGKTMAGKAARKFVADRIENQFKKNMVELAGKGVVGEAAEATARDAATKAVMQKMAQWGGTAALTGYTSLQEGGSNWGQDVTSHGLEGTSPGQDLFFGLLSGMSEAVLGAESSILRAWTGKKVSDQVEQAFRKEFLKGLPKAAASEGGQEAFQEMLSSINANIQDAKGLLTTEDLEGMFNAAMAGALGGTVMHVPTLIGERRGKKAKDADEQKIENLQKEIEENKKKEAEAADKAFRERFSITTPEIEAFNAETKELVQQLDTRWSNNKQYKNLTATYNKYRDWLELGDARYSLPGGEKEENVALIAKRQLEDYEKRWATERENLIKSREQEKAKLQYVDIQSPRGYMSTTRDFTPDAYFAEQDRIAKEDPLAAARTRLERDKQAWTEHDKAKRAEFEEKWAKKSAALLKEFSVFDKQDKTRWSLNEWANFKSLLARKNKLEEDKKKEKEDLDRALAAGYRVSDTRYINEFQRQNNIFEQKEKIDKALGSGAFDSITQTLSDAVVYHDKAQESAKRTLADIDQAITDTEAKINEGQKNLTLTAKDYKLWNERIEELRAQRTRVIRATRKMSKLMGKISDQNAYLSSANYRELAYDIQELYNEGDGIFGIERTDKVFRQGQAVQLAQVKDRYERLSDQIKKAQDRISNFESTPVLDAIGQAFRNTETSIANTNFERDYPLQSPAAKPVATANDAYQSIRKQLEQQQAFDDWKSINDDFDSAQRQQIRDLNSRIKKGKEDSNIANLLKTTGQKKKAVPENIQYAIANSQNFYKNTLDKLAEIQKENDYNKRERELNELFGNPKYQKHLIEMQRSSTAAMDMILKEQENPLSLATRLIGQNRKSTKDKTVNSVINFLKNTLKSLPGLKDNTVICYDHNDASIPLELKNMLANVNLGITNGVKYLFTGEKGAYSLDMQQEVTTRMDNLNIATGMRSAGVPADKIKLATGWEYNPADRKWRYEIDDSMMSFTDYVTDMLKVASEIETDLGSVLKNGDVLFNAYPSMKDMRVRIVKTGLSKSGLKGSLDLGNNTIILYQNAMSSYEDTFLTLLHEMQHAIQDIEGFTQGTSPEGASKARDLDITNNKIRIMRLRKVFERSSILSKEIDSTIERLNSLREKYISDISPYAYDIFSDPDTLLSDYQLIKARIKEEGRKLKEEDPHVWSRYVRIPWRVNGIDVDSSEFDLNPAGVKKMSALDGDRYIWEKLRGDLNLLGDKVSENFRLTSLVERYRNGISDIQLVSPFSLYKRNTGEVEARNVTSRHGMSAEERSSSPAYMTHDVAYEDQQTMYRAMNGQVKGAYYNGKLYIFAKNMEGQEDAIRTLIHEGVAHYGLRSIMNNEQLGQFLDLVFNSFANTDSWKKFATARPEYFKTNDRLTQAEEYVAYIAEQMKVSELINPENQSIFNRIVMFLRNILSKLGLKTTLTHKDIRDVLKLSAYNLQKKGGQKDLISELNNIDMYQADQQNKEMTLSEEPIYGVKFDDVQSAKVYFANADASRTGIPYTRFAKNEPNNTNTLNLNDSMSQQHEKIKSRLEKIFDLLNINPAVESADDNTHYVVAVGRVFGPYEDVDSANEFIKNGAFLDQISGWDAYNYITQKVGSKREATRLLNHHGIRGAQYLNMGKNTYYLFEGNNINTVPYQYDLNKLSEPKFLVTDPKDMVLDPETGEPTTKDTPDQWTYHNELFNQVARESSWLRKVASVIKTGTSRADDGSLIEHNGWERFVEGTVDRYRRLKVVQDYLKKKFKGAVNFTTNVYQNLQGLTNRISERQVDAANKYLKPVEDVLKEVTVDLPIYKDGKLVGYKKSTDSDYQDFMLRLFDGFLHARHAQERNKSVSERFRGRRWLDKDGNPHHKNMKSAEQGQDIINASGMSDAEAQHLIDILGSISGFQEAAALVDKMNRYTLETMLEMKLITQEDFNNMAKYNYYVPLTGWEDMVEHFAPGRYRPRGRSLSTGGKRPVQFAKGRDNKLPSSPLLRSWQQMDDIIALGMRNEVMRGFGQLVKNTSSETELWEVDRKNPEAVRLQVTKNGDIILVTKPSELHGSGDSAVSYIDENGKPVRIVIKDKWLADAMRGENMAPTGAIVDMMRKYTGMMSKLMTSRNPLFTLVNPIRDLTTAYLNLGSVIEENQMRGLMEKNGVIQNSVIKEAFAGNIRNILFDLAMADEGKKPFDASKYDPQIVQDVMDWRKNGGHTKSISVYDLQDRSKALRANIRKDGIKKQYDEAMKYLDILSDTAENIVRFSVYRNVQRAFEENIRQRAKAEGWSSARVQQEIEMAKQKSANIALDCTVNFTKRGAWANVFNPLFAFSSASIQGFARIANNLWRPTSTPLQNFKRVSKFMAMGTCAPLMHGFICRAIMGDDEDGLNKYDKIPAYIKETNLIIPMPFGDGGYIKVPLPYGYNVFWSMGTTLDTVMAGHQHPADGALSIMKNALSNITPLDPSQGAVAFVPTIFKPLVELAANKNFAGAPIKPEGYSTDMLPEHLKSWERTPHGYKWVAEQLNFITGGFMTKSNIGALDISPETIEHLANSYLGGIYRIFSQATDLAMSPMMGYQVEAKNIPLLNRLYGVTDDDNTRAIYNRYADHVRSAQVLKKQLKGTEEEKDLLDARRNVFSVEKQYTAVSTELNKVKQAKKDLAKRYPKRGEAYYNQLKLLEKREEKIMQKFNRVAHRAGLTME